MNLYAKEEDYDVKETPCNNSYHCRSIEVEFDFQSSRNHLLAYIYVLLVMLSRAFLAYMLS